MKAINTLIVEADRIVAHGVGLWRANLGTACGKICATRSRNRHIPPSLVQIAPVDEL